MIYRPNDAVTLMWKQTGPVSVDYSSARSLAIPLSRKMDGRFSLSLPDYVVFGLCLALSLVVGLIPAYKGRKNKSLENYLMAGRKMNAIPVGLSLFVSVCSTVPLLAGPVEVYNYGIAYWALMMGSGICFAVVAHFFSPIFHSLQLISIHEVRFI